MPPKIDLELCQKCGTCEDSCPLDVIYFHPEDGGVEIRYPDECWHCGSCRQDCPTSAITIIFPPIMANI